MSEYGTFEYGTGTVYGSGGFAILKIEVLARDLIRIITDAEVVVNSEYLNKANYSVFRTDDPASVLNVRRVLALQDDSKVTTEISLRIDRHTPGVLYDVLVASGSVKGRDGIAIDTGSIGRFISRETKADTIIASVPRHFDFTPGSNVRGVLQAIANADDVIGGSQSDTLTESIVT